MKKPFIMLVTCLIVAFGLITILRRRSAETMESATSTADPEKHRTQNFWTLYSQASKDRTAGQYEQAVSGFRASLEINPKHEDSLYYLAISLRELGEYQEAEAVLRRLIEANPTSNRAYSELGHSLALPEPGVRVDFKAARAALERSVQLNPEQANSFLELGKLEFSEGDTEAAVKHFRVAAGFQSPEANFWVGYALFSTGDYAEASRFFLKVLQIQKHELAISGKGLVSEGDFLPRPGKPMSPLERAGLKSLLFLYWSSVRLGGYPPATPKEFIIHKPVQPSLPFLTRITAGIWKPRGGRCVEQLQQAGLVPAGRVVDCIVDDFNADGNPDLFILRWRKEAILYLSDGNGKFSDATGPAGLSGLGGQSFSAVSFDYDRDGHPDLLVTSHAPFEEVVRSLLQPDYKATQYTPRLFRNKGAGEFEEITTQAGLNRSYGTMQAIASDFDGDGWLDLLLVNGSLDRLRIELSVVLRNLAGKGFRESAYLPDFDQPDNFIGATPDGRDQNRKPIVQFVSNSFSGD